MQRTLWVERVFTFDHPAGWMPDILERLRGTPIRLSKIVMLLPEEMLLTKPDNAWSLKEHVGHLGDLEELHDGRITDFLARKGTLRAADMSNKQTNEADHNKQPIGVLLARFAERRNRLIEHFEELDDETQLFRSLHPRLQVMVRPIDIAYFTAEHDDHHLATMRMLFHRE